MKNLEEICRELSELYSKIVNVGVSSSSAEDRKKFIDLKNEVKNHFPNDPLFNKKIYTTSSFDYKYPQMQNECLLMIQLVCKQQ